MFMLFVSNVYLHVKNAIIENFHYYWTLPTFVSDCASASRLLFLLEPWSISLIDASQRKVIINMPNVAYSTKIISTSRSIFKAILFRNTI